MFEINDVVEVQRNPPVRGKLVAVLTKEREAMVRFRNPRHPQECANCGSLGNLSVNVGNGEVVCLRTGCGHGHGFDERDEVIPLSQLVNISAIWLVEKKLVLRRQIADLLSEGVSGGLLTPEDKHRILASW